MDKAIPKQLIGKAGVGLACFHLARRGHDFVLTTDNSLDGDLWVNFDGGMERVEVKATTRLGWNLRAKQLARVSRVIFADIQDGECWLASAVDVLRTMRGRAEGVITRKQVEALGAAAWHKDTYRLVPRNPKAIRGAPSANAKPRKVKKVLADGTTKIYFYPPRGPVQKILQTPAAPVTP
jgi:hypothetical protein